MRDPERLVRLTRELGAHERERLPIVDPPRDSVHTSQVDRQEAQEKLALQRTGSVYYKDPNKQKRNVFRSKGKKQALNDHSGWNFTKAERFAVLDRQIREGAPVNEARAILDLSDPLDINGSYESDEHGIAVATGKPNGWLNIVARRNDVNYVRLLCVFGASQECRDQALEQALRQKASAAAQELLRKNANPNATAEEFFLTAIEEQDTVLINLFLTSIVQLDKVHIDKASVMAAGRGTPDLLALLFAHGASSDYAEGRALCMAIARSHPEDAATILYHSDGAISDRSLSKAIKAASVIESEAIQQPMFEMLLCAGADPNSPTLLDQLSKAVEKGCRPLVELLISYKTSPDYNNGECLRLAITSQQIELVAILLQGYVSQDSASGALDETKAIDVLEQYESVVSALVAKGVSEDSLHRCLACTVEKGCDLSLAQMLISAGANLEYADAKCVRMALLQNDFRLFRGLLQGYCNPSILCKVLPDAMRVQPQSERFHVMSALLEKGVNGKELHAALQMVVSEANEAIDYQLMGLLVRKNASVDFSDDNGNCICVAVTHEDEKALSLLLEAAPSRDTVSVALSFLRVSFRDSEDIDYERALRIARMLLESGAHGSSVAQMLVEAVHSDYRGKSFELLLDHEADANYKGGKAIEAALRLENIARLDQLCRRSKLEKATLAKQLPNALDPDGFSLQKVIIIAQALSVYGYKSELDQPLVDEIQTNGSRKEVIELLLALGASVNYKDGKALGLAVSKGNIQATRLLLLAKPTQISRDSAAYAAIYSKLDIEARKEVYLTLFKSGINRDLISTALFEATCQDVIDISLVSLLINFKASLDAHDGGAMYNFTAMRDPKALSTLLNGEVTLKETLDRSFARCMDLKGEARRDIAKLLLAKEPGVNIRTISHFLSHVVREKDTKLLDLIAGYKPDPTYNGGESIILAAKGGDEESTAILTRGSVPISILNKAFEAMLDKRTIRSKSNGLRIANILLSLGIDQYLLDRALLDGFDDPIDQHTRELIELLIPYGPDFSGGSGKVFVIAADSREVELFRLMASQGPDLNVVIPALILSFRVTQGGEQMETREAEGQKEINEEMLEEILVSYLLHLADCSSEDGVVLNDSVIFTAMKIFSQGTSLIKHLLDHGCPANSKIYAALHLSGKIPVNGAADELEQMTAVMWALSYAEQTISEDVILEILERGQDAEVLFETSITHTTATILASAAGREKVLKRLVEIGVNTSRCDSYGHTALFYASRNGHLGTVEILHAAGAKANDGSLHEAAREGHFEIVQFLLEHGHRPDFPSVLHADALCGRTALEELCLNSAPGHDTNVWDEHIHRCIELLLPKNVDDVQQTGGKTMLHLALENSNPIPVTRAMLEFTTVWENINHPMYLFQNGQGYYFSLTKYVERFYTGAHAETQRQLILLLRGRKCADKFYTHSGAQPPGAIGLPKEVALLVEKQRHADHEHSEAMRRLDELTAKRRSIEEEDNQRSIANDKARHVLLMRQQRKREEEEKQAAERMHTTAQARAQELQQELQAAVKEEGRIRQQGLDEEASRRHKIRQTEQAAAKEEMRIRQQGLSDEASRRHKMQQSEQAATKEEMRIRLQGLSEEQSLRNTMEQAAAKEAVRIRQQGLSEEASRRRDMQQSEQAAVKVRMTLEKQIISEREKASKRLLHLEGEFYSSY